MKPIALQMYTLREMAAEDFRGTVEKVAGLGYKGIEFAGFYDTDPKEVRKWLDDLGIVCCSFHGPLVTPENRAEQVDTAGALGAAMLVNPYQSAEQFATAETIERLGEQLARSAELLAPDGIRFGYHNHWWEMAEVDGRYALDRLLGSSGQAFCELDTYWAAHFGDVDVPPLVAKHKKKTPLLHIKDGPLAQDEPHTAVGSGKMNVPEVIAAADEETLEWVIVELDTCAGDMFEAVAKSYRYLTGEGLAEGAK